MTKYRVWYSFDDETQAFGIDVDAVDVEAPTEQDARNLAKRKIEAAEPELDFRIDDVYVLDSRKSVYKPKIV